MADRPEEIEVRPGFRARVEIKMHLRAALDWVEELESDEVIRLVQDDVCNALDHLLDSEPRSLTDSPPT